MAKYISHRVPGVADKKQLHRVESMMERDGALVSRIADLTKRYAREMRELEDKIAVLERENRTLKAILASNDRGGR